MSKSSKNKHYALSQMKELRQQYVEMVELGKRNHKALMQHKAQRQLVTRSLIRAATGSLVTTNVLAAHLLDAQTLKGTLGRFTAPLGYSRTTLTLLSLYLIVCLAKRQYHF